MVVVILESMISSCFQFFCVVTSSHCRCAMACNPGRAGAMEGSVQYGDRVGPGRRPTLRLVQWDHSQYLDGVFFLKLFCVRKLLLSCVVWDFDCRTCNLNWPFSLSRVRSPLHWWSWVQFEAARLANESPFKSWKPSGGKLSLVLVEPPVNHLLKAGNHQ